MSLNTRSGLVCWSLVGDLILEPNFWKYLWFAYALASLIPIPELWLKASLTRRSNPNAVEFLKTTNMRLGLWPEMSSLSQILGNACALPMPRWVSSPFQNFGSRLALVGRPTPNAVKFINIWLDLQLPGRRSNPWAKFLGMPVPCLCLGMSYSNFRNLAQGLHNWWDPLQCGAISQNTRSGLVCWSLDGDLILEPNFWKCLWFAYA